MQQVFDAHVDTLMRIGDPEQFLKGTDRTHLDMPRAIKAGVSHLVTAVCSESEKDPLKAFHNGYSNFLELQRHSSITLHLMLEGCQQLCELADSDEIIRRVSVASLTWNGRNSLGGGIGTDTGLTDPGRSLALELHDSGVVLDVSHLCDRSRIELMSLGIDVVATHCNCRALHDFPRNLPDDDLRRIAASGGVVGITFVPAFLGGGEALEDIVRHLEHLVDVAGIDAAGFGSDFDGVGRLPGGVPDCTVWPSLFELLDRRGWSDEDIDRVAFGNWSRVIK
jgi:membrane dipeptidase